MDFEHPKGKSFGLAGSFSVKQDIIAKRLQRFGIKREKDVNKCHFIIASEDALQNKFVNDARAANLPVLKEFWLESVLSDQKWIVPEAIDYYYTPKAGSAPGAASDRSTPETQMSSTFSESAGGSTREATPDANGSKHGQIQTSTGSAAQVEQEGHEELDGQRDSAAGTDGSAAPTTGQEGTTTTTGQQGTTTTGQDTTTTGQQGTTTATGQEGTTTTTGQEGTTTTTSQEGTTTATGQEGTTTTTSQEGTTTTTSQRATELNPAPRGYSLEGARRNWYAKKPADFEYIAPVHPADKGKPKDQQRTNYVMNIDFIVRHFVFVSDPKSAFPTHKIPRKTKMNLKASWLIPKKDIGTRGQEYVDKRGHVLTTTSEDILREHAMEDFDWWGTATDGRICYNAGILPGETEPRVWARTTQKKVWTDIDKEIDSIRKVFGQPALAEEKKHRRQGEGKSRILENLMESEK